MEYDKIRRHASGNWAAIHKTKRKAAAFFVIAVKYNKFATFIKSYQSIKHDINKFD